MKKIILSLLLLVSTLSASAQFSFETKYFNASMTGLDLSYGSDSRLNLGIEATGGYFFDDAWMLYGRFGYNHQHIKGPGNDVNNLSVGAGVRYYILQNGLFLGAGAKFVHENRHPGNFFDLTPEVGYCFYLNHNLSIEPVVYYDLCINQYSAGSKVGLRIGLGYYF